MLRALVCVGVGWVVFVGGLRAADKPGRVEGTVKKMDTAKNTITITTKDGTDREFTLAGDTKVTGPKGTVSDKGLADERLKEGAHVVVTTAPDGKAATAIRLGGPKKGADK